MISSIIKGIAKFAFGTVKVLFKTIAVALMIVGGAYVYAEGKEVFRKF